MALLNPIQHVKNSVDLACNYASKVYNSLESKNKTCQAFESSIWYCLKKVSLITWAACKICNFFSNFISKKVPGIINLIGKNLQKDQISQEDFNKYHTFSKL
jgi:hypothetical protein